MKNIGILGAMDEEITGIVKAMDGGCEKKMLFGSPVYSGRINGRTVHAAKTGIGKVNAAFMAAALHFTLGADAVVMTGIAGGIKGKTMDAVVPTGFVQHDVFMPEAEDGFIDTVGAVVIRADKALSDLMADGSSLRGLIATGEAFVSDKNLSESIAKRFPDVVAVDMECAAAAQVCLRLGIPFAAVKIISDGCDDGEYFDFKQQAADKAVGIALRLFSRAIA